MHKVLFLLFFCFQLSMAIAQPNIQWQLTLGGSYYEHPTAAYQTPDGGYFIAGHTNSEDGDVDGNHGYHDFWAVKLDSSGNVLWKKAYGGSGEEWAFDAKLTSDGGFILVGFTESDDGDVQGNHGGKDIWVLKLNGFGNIEWQKCLGGSGWEEGWSIQQTKEGGFIVAGLSTSTDGEVSGNHGGFDYWVVKLGLSGQIEWQRSYGGSYNDFGYTISQTSDEGYIVAGEAQSTDGDVTNNLYGSSFWALKLNFEGKIEWQKALGGSGIDRANQVIQTKEGGYILVGQTYSNDGDVSGNHGDFDYWVVKLSEQGDLEWQKALGGSNKDFGRSIFQTSEGDFIVIGSVNSNNGDVTGNHGGGDFWLVQLNEIGELQWQRTFGGTLQDWGNTIQPTNDGGFIMTGYSWSVNGDVSENKGKADFWIVKLSPESSPTSAPAPLPLEISPNPAQNTIRLKVPSLDKDLNILVTDLLGREVQQRSIPNPQSGSVALDLAAFPNGLYWVRVTTNSGAVYLGKVLKQG